MLRCSLRDSAVIWHREMLLISDREIDAWISRSLRERWVPILSSRESHDAHTCRQRQ